MTDTPKERYYTDDGEVSKEEFFDMSDTVEIIAHRDEWANEVIDVMTTDTKEITNDIRIV